MATHKLVKVNADSEIVFGEGIFDEVNKFTIDNQQYFLKKTENNPEIWNMYINTDQPIGEFTNQRDVIETYRIENISTPGADIQVHLLPNRGADIPVRLLPNIGAGIPVHPLRNRGVINRAIANPGVPAPVGAPVGDGDDPDAMDVVPGPGGSRKKSKKSKSKKSKRKTKGGKKQKKQSKSRKQRR